MKDAVYMRYLLTNERDLQWGLTVTTVGHQFVAPGEEYPPRQNHLPRYLFSPEKGRILSEYQLIYLMHGRGTFASASCRETTVCAGDVILLFPGEWHSYHPDQVTGWDEYWIGCNGPVYDSLIEREFFTRLHPVLNVGIQEPIVQFYNQAYTIAQEQKAGFQQALAGIVFNLAGHIYTLDRQSSFAESKTETLIQRAKIIILESMQNQIAPEELAERLHVSYSWLRRIFKQYTGFAPSQYILEMRIQRSKELLTNTDMTSQEVAYDTGFESPDYFCTIFKKKAGMSPIKYREFTQGTNLHPIYFKR